MANVEKNYFLSPGWDYSPSSQPGATIALWNLVSSPTRMMPPLAAATAQPDPSVVAETTKYGVEWSREENRGYTFGVWTKFITAMFPGVGVDAGAQWTTMSQDLFHFETMITKEAYPPDEYLQRMVSQAPVRVFLERHRFKRQLYVVVGTKAVVRGSAKHVSGKKFGTDMKLSADLTLTSAPVSLGPEASTASSDGNMTSFRGASDFVFAYRLRKIVIDKKFNIVKQERVKGGILGPSSNDLTNVIHVRGLEPVDSTVAEIGQQETVYDDGEQVSVTVLD